MKTSSYKGLEMTISPTRSYGRYEITARIKGLQVVAYTNDAEVYDYFDEPYYEASDPNYARRVAYHALKDASAKADFIIRMEVGGADYGQSTYVTDIADVENGGFVDADPIENFAFSFDEALKTKMELERYCHKRGYRNVSFYLESAS